MYDVATLGEVMVRLSPPYFRRLEQATSLEVNVGGSELSVAIGVSRLGLKSAWVSRLPLNPLGFMIRNKAREQGVDYGVAFSALKHSIPGDINWTGIEEVESQVKGGTLRISR